MHQPEITFNSTFTTYQLYVTITSISSVFTRQNAFEKNYLGYMLIEQIIEVESRVLGLQVVHISKTGYFHDKTKIFKGKPSSE